MLIFAIHILWHLYWEANESQICVLRKIQPLSTASMPTCEETQYSKKVIYQSESGKLKASLREHNNYM